MYTLITGASSGLGRELAIHLSRDRSLILNGRNIDRLKETKSCCHNDNIRIWPYDLEETQNLEQDFALWMKENAIEIEAFVHCAGFMKMVPIRSVDYMTLLKTYSVNVFSAATIIKVLTARKINSKNLKAVVFISSNISNRGAAAFSAYGSSKAAVDGLMRNLAVELAPNVRLNSVLPGGMHTEMTEALFEDEGMQKQFDRNYPLGIGTPEDIVPMVDFLLSEKSNWITGQQFTVDGGRTINITERSN